MHSVYLVLAALIISVQSFEVPTNESTHNWFTIGDKKYYIRTDATSNFWGAAEFCASIYMKLLTVETEAENAAVLSVLESHTATETTKRCFWTSGNRLAESSNDWTWTWLTTGNKITFFDWGSGEPNNQEGDEECICMWNKKYYSQGSWDDEPCTNQKGAICES
uniref:L-selectin-like n=1 Tax=Diabrotica virgifera virgifera TaxID=50390 RepID=A0A6P7GDW6_DIAVI